MLTVAPLLLFVADWTSLSVHEAEWLSSVLIDTEPLIVAIHQCDVKAYEIIIKTTECMLFLTICYILIYIYHLHINCCSITSPSLGPNCGSLTCFVLGLRSIRWSSH